MALALVCWKCGVSVAEMPLPLSRLAECPKCRAYLHACRMCEFYDPRIANQCHEDRAEEVLDKERANFCEWFKPRPDAHRPPGGEKTRAAKAKLDNIFGGEAIADGKTDATQDKLSELFGGNNKTKK